MLDIKHKELHNPGPPLNKNMDIDDITDLICVNTLYYQIPSKKGSSSNTDGWMIMKKGKAVPLSNMSDRCGAIKEYVHDCTIETNKKMAQNMEEK